MSVRLSGPLRVCKPRRTVPVVYGLLFPKIGGSTQPPPQTSTSIISGTDKTPDLKFSQYIYMVHRNKSPLKILEKKERGHIQQLPKFGGAPYYLMNG